MERRVIVILGCTASGKGALARALAERLDAELLSVDSMKIYRGLDIGTAKPSAAERARRPHHLIDVADPWESFSAARFVALADAAVDAVHARGRPVVAVGGTMLYFKCWYCGLFEGPSADPAIRAAIRARAAGEGLETLYRELQRVDPDAATRIHRNDLRRIERALEVHQLTGRPISALQREWERSGPRRPELLWTLMGVRRDKEEASRRINARVHRMISEGLVDEARRVWSDPRGVGEQAAKAVGYAELFAHFAGRCTLDDAVERIKINTRRLAKAQRTWLKTIRAVQWLEATGIDDAATLLSDAADLSFPVPRE